tara:strand:- start:334 stop:648 length:315 start_codon:yes stop_codon:yes gene_type:complete
MITLEQIYFAGAIKKLDTNKAVVGWSDNLFTSLDLASGKELVFTDSELTAEITRLEAEYDTQEYARNRSTEYPALAEQLDEIYHNGIDSWKAVIKVTKDKYPKG